MDPAHSVFVHAFSILRIVFTVYLIESDHSDGAMSNMENILVAVDGSKYSEKTVKIATEIATKTPAVITLLYVIKAPSEEPEGLKEFERTENAKDAYATYLQEIGNKVLSSVGKILTEAKISYESIVDMGNPAERILEVAGNKKSKFIVLGLRGLHGVARLESLGSVARRVIENSKCPVIVVPTTD